MTNSLVGAGDCILAVDIGATSIKSGLVDSRGDPLGSVHRVPTPYPCSPARLVEVVADLIVGSGCSCVGIGFPGEFVDGLVVEPGNLSRPGGITTEVDPVLDHEWRNFDFQRAIRAACGGDVRVVNDATLAALGCCDGRGRELVFTLGTGFGIALVVNGSLQRIRDVGAEVFLEGGTYDQLLGETSRSRDPARWNVLVRQAVGDFVDEFQVDTVHLGGGNSRQVDLGLYKDLGRRIVVNDNDVTLRGAAKLFAH